jgi:prepilin-type N-terminal cleavage/methylation domain-containing protein
MKINTANKSGFTLVEIMIVVAIIGLLAAIAIPNFVRARASSQANACINNLRQIDGATQQWALENKAGPSAAVSFLKIQPYLKNSVLCPSGGTGATFATSYSLNTVTNKPSCKFGSAYTPTAHVLPPDTTG